MRHSLSRKLRHLGGASFAFALIVAVIAGGVTAAPLSASAANSPVTGFSIVTNYDGVSIPNAVDASANNGQVATNDAVGFSWSFVTARDLAGATITQTLPAGWSWDPAATGALTATLPAYQSTAVISADLRTITATLSAGAGADITLGPIKAIPTTVADGSVYTPQVDITDGAGSDTATTSPVTVVSGAPLYTVTALRSQTTSTAATYMGVNGQATLVRVTLDLSAYVGQPNLSIPAGSQFTLTVSNIADPIVTAQSGPIVSPVTHSNRVTTFTTTSAVQPGSSIQAAVTYFWANTILPAAATARYDYAAVSVAGFTPTPESILSSESNVASGTAAGIGSWTLFSCPTATWSVSACTTSIAQSNQEPNPAIAFDGRVLHGVNYRGALDANALSVGEPSVTLTSLWQAGHFRPVTSAPLEVRVTTGPSGNLSVRILAESEYSLRYRVGSTWTAATSWSSVPSSAVAVEVTVTAPWAAGLVNPNLRLSVPLQGATTTPVAGSIRGEVAGPIAFGRSRIYRMVASTDSATFTVDRSSVTAPTTLRYTGTVVLTPGAGAVAPASTPGITVTQTFPSSVLDVVPVGLDPSWTFSKSFDGSGQIIATFVHGPFATPATLPALVVDATLSPIAPPSGSVAPSMTWVVQNGTSSLTAPTPLTAPTVVTQAQVIALTTSAAKRTVEAGETPLSWTVGWSNFKAASQGLTYVVGVLPATGDAFGSSFHGSIEFGDVSLCTGASGTTLQYTTDAAAATRPADDSATVWAPVTGSSLSGLGAKAFRVVINDFQPGSSCSLSLSTNVSGNVDTDRYAMSVFGKSAVGGSLPQTVPTEVDVVASSVSGRVVRDTAASGAYGAAMAGFANATVELLTTTNTVLRTTTTASDGSYLFDGLPSGQYRVRVVASSLPAGSAATFSPSLPITLAKDQDLTTAHFGFIVYVPDLQVSQSYVLPSTVAAGQTVELTYTATNTGNGRLSSVAFTGITLGTPTYTWPTATPNRLDPQQTVTVKVLHVLTQAEVDAGTLASSFTVTGTDPVSQSISKTSTEAVPLAALAELSVTKSGSFTGLSVAGAPVSWTIEVTNTGAVTVSNVTVADALPGLSALVYAWPSGGTAGTLAPGQKVTVTATSALTAAHVAAGAVTNTASASGTTPQLAPVTSTLATATVTLPSGSISGRVVNDPTASGVPSPSLTGFAGVTVELRDNSGTVLLTTVTSATGAYQFTGLTPGSYAVHPLASSLPTGASATFAPAPPVIALAAGQQVTSADLGFIVYAPQVTLSQSHVLPSSIVAGEVVQVTYVVTNTGNGALSSVALSGMVSGTSTPTWPGTAGQLGLGQSVTYTVDHVLTAAEVNAGSLLSAFTASGVDPVGQTASGSSSVAIPLTGSPSLAVTASGTYSGLAAVGSPVSWTFQVTNTGTVTLTDVSIAGSVPGLSALQYTWPGSTAGELAPGQTATATATSSVTAGQLAASLVTNTVTGSATTLQGSSVTSPNVTASVTLPSGSISGRLVEDPTASGTYGASMTGFGGIPVELRSQAGAVLDTTTTAADGSYRFRGLPAADYEVRVEPTTLPNGASATFAPTGLTTVTAAAAVTDVNFGFILYAPELTVTQSNVLPTPIAAGQSVSVTYTLTNTGNAPLTGVTATGALLASGSPVETWPATPGELAPGESATITVAITLTQEQVDAGSLDSQLSASGVDPLGEPAGDSSSVTIPLAALADLSVTTTGTFTGLTIPGAVVSWEIAVTNTGAVTVSDVTITNSLSGLSDLTYTWPAGGTAGVLAPGETVTAVATSALTADQIAQLEVTNTATAQGRRPQGQTVVSAPGSDTVTLERAEGISLSLTSSLPNSDTPPGPTVQAGTPITWTYTVTNTGRGPVSSIQLTDSTGSTPAVVSPAGFAGVLDPGQTVTFESTTPAVAGQQRVDATATATVDSTGSPLTADLGAVDIVTVTAAATAYYSGLAAPADADDKPGSNLARTGLELAPALGTAAALLVLGVWLLGARRRRTRHDAQ